jgi:hypothetical protein
MIYLIIISLLIGLNYGHKSYGQYLTKDRRVINNKEANDLNTYVYAKLLLLVLLLLISIYHLFNHQP